MKKIAQLLFLFSLPLLIQAQGGWVSMEKGLTELLHPISEPDLIDMIQLTDGSIVSCGRLESVMADSLTMFIQKTSASGLVLWETRITKNVTWMMYGFQHILQTNDGGFIVSAIDESIGTPVIIKLDSTGSVIWDTDDTPEEFITLFNGRVGIAQRSDEEITILYFDYDVIDSTIYYYNLDISSGLIISDGVLDIPGGLIEHFDMLDFAITNDGGIILLCKGNGNFIWKLNSLLETDWYYHFYVGDYPQYQLESVKQTSDEGFILCGSYDESLVSNSQAAIIRFDDEGLVLWEKYYGEVNSLAFDIAEHEDGSLTYIEGFANHLVFLTSSGDSLYSISLIDNYSFQPSYSIIGTLDGGFALGGRLSEVDDNYYCLIKSSPEGLLPDCIFNCVWPGDANNNSIANMDDLLTIGIAYDATGPLREDIGNEWYGHSADMWIDTLADGINYKYADCNGDGIINSSDTIAISLNYGETHPIYTLKTNGAEEIYLDPEFDTLPLGLVEIPIMLSDDASPVTIYGLRFSIAFEGDEVIDSTSMVVDFNSSWLGEPGEIISMNKLFPEIKTIDAGVTRIDHVNVTGGGQIGTLSFVVIDNIAGKILSGATELTITIQSIHAIKAEEEIVPLSGSSFIFHLGTEIQADESAQFNMYPNPVPGNELNIVFPLNLMIEEVIISDITGRVLFIGSNIDTSLPLAIPDLPNGEYIVKLISGHQIHTALLIVAK